VKKITGTHVHHCKASEFATAVFAPRVVPGRSGVFHGPDGIYGLLPLFADPLTGSKVFKVPAGEAEYTLTTSARRSARGCGEGAEPQVADGVRVVRRRQDLEEN
jgi:hypothetical protein